MYYTLTSLDDTCRLAASIADLAERGDVITLKGNLGIGKTAFARAFIQHLSPIKEEVTSPTFTLLQTYDSPKGEIWHLDLYRLEQPEDVLELGIEDGFEQAVMLIEWPDVIEHLLPENQLAILLEFTEQQGERNVSLTGYGNWNQKLATLDDHT